MIRILIADDNRSIRSALALLLETRLGIIVGGEANTMESLLAKLESLRPDIVIVDWDLPGHPQQARIEAIRSLQPAVRVIVVNSRPEAEAQSAGADAFIYRTDPPETIISAIQSLLPERKNS